ncbi:nuclease-related domain-containing protein [Streptomyces sp. NPDC006422]|uniref:nuclease-related domain-containing protein n=1 Tax=unclassified Streptomyces TaxID=2593676 RepID=UPI00339DE1CB
MSGLRVIPTWRHGREWLYVCGEDGGTVAWYDREADRVSLLDEARGGDALEALRPFLVGSVAVGPPPVPTPAELAGLALHPDDDLAPNRPGEHLAVALDRDPGPPRRLRADPRRRALAAQQRVGEVLDGLEAAGWRVLHAVPLPGGTYVHHLVIGPGGLYALHTVPARGRRVRVADPFVTIGRAEPQPLLRRARADASRCSYALTVEVHPALVLVTPSSAVPPAPHLFTDTTLPTLSRTGGHLKPADVEALHMLARDRGTWTRA